MTTLALVISMRIIHTSDWHLGQHFYGKNRANEHQQFLSWLLEQIENHQVDAVIVAGDIFDTGTPASYAREMYFDFIVQVHKLNCQLLILAGNHDSVAMLNESKQLLSNLSCKVIPSVSSDIDEQVFVLKDQQGLEQAVICAIPFIRPRDVIHSQAGQSAMDKQQSLQQAISDHYQTLYQHAQTLADNTLPIIATGHLTTVGVSVTESVREIYIGTLDAFPVNAFPPADYIALGHIHRAQKVAKSEHIRYSGSPIPLSFDEAKQAKQILVAEFSGSNLQQVSAIEIPRFQAMAMMKTTIDSMADDIQALSLANKDKETVWLDIEIESAGYLQNIQGRIDTLVTDTNIEVLLVRRSKAARQLMPEQHTKITLNELTLDDVFHNRMAQEDWKEEAEQARKIRLEQLFKQIASEAQSEQTPLLTKADKQETELL